jgi:hypothetical protein
VGRDLLFGAVIGGGMVLVQILAKVSPMWMGKPTSLLLTPGSFALGQRFFLMFTEQLSAALFQAFISLFLLLLFVIVLRRERLALTALWLLMTVLSALISQSSLAVVPFIALGSFLQLFALKRYGLLAMISAIFFAHLLVFYTITTELTAWYAADFTIALVICIALAVYGFYTSLGGQPLFGGKLLQD